MKKNKVLVTGGGGFIGKHLINLLTEKGYHVSLLDRSDKIDDKRVKVFKGDVCDRKVVAKAMKGMDYVYHLAGLLGTEELLFESIEATKVNVIGALTIMEEAAKNKTKLLLVSKPNPWLNTYSITKEASEKFCMMFQKEFGLKAAIVKWFSVYGPGQKHYGVQKAVPTFIVAALKGEPLPVFDRGQQTADFIYASDAVRATVEVAESKEAEGQIVEIGTGEETKIIDLAKLVIKMTNSKSKIKFLKMRKGEDLGSHVVADIRLLKRFTGFKPEVDFQTGMQKTIDYYREIVKK
jgi:UDP-glucose 4-epimerase